MKKRLLVCGFGRMGLSHSLQMMGICRSLDFELDLFVCDSSRLARFVALFLCPGVKFVSSKELVAINSKAFDYAIDSTPPIDRQRSVRTLERVAERVLIEKPVMAKLSSSSMSGYVLQHNPLLPDLASVVADTKAITVQVLTNVDFRGGGWRSGRHGGLASEYLGHCLSVPGAIFPKMRDLRLVESNVCKDSIEIRLQSFELTLTVYLKAGRSDVRKAAYSWRFFTSTEIDESDTHIEFDLYQIKSWRKGVADTLTGISEKGVAVPYYLRGFDFAAQSRHFIEGKGDMMESSVLEAIEQVVSEAANIEYENRSGR